MIAEKIKIIFFFLYWDCKILYSFLIQSNLVVFLRDFQSSLTWLLISEIISIDS